ncbi:MAG: hypothetical protein RLZZ89_1178 [Cyanobacteriota bacterium]
MKRALSLVLLTTGLVFAYQPQAIAQKVLENIGNLTISTNNCSRNLEDQPQGPCSRVVLDQLQKDVISVRFIARGKQPDSSNQLTLAGSSLNSLECKNTRCVITGPIELELSSISEVSYNNNGIAEEMPKAWPVLGNCKLEVKSISCKARSIQGQRWEANASF